MLLKWLKTMKIMHYIFSRSCIPHIRDNSQLLIDEKKFFESAVFYKHVGIYGYKKDFLNKILNPR